MSMVMTWLWHSMEPSVASTVQFLDIVKKIWNALEEMYSQTSNAFQISETMFSTKQGGKPLNEHYALLHNLWEELLIYQPITPDVETQCKQREDFKYASAAFVSNGRGGSVRGGRGHGGHISAPRGGTHGGRGSHGPRPDWLCDYYGNISHTKPFYYKKNGYPPSVNHAFEELSSNNP
ncbi:hypothetical protein IFM89_012128 [Coptis chinensis]|uniref:Retrotransposon gag domain-containing protein n=1 Tax=Coptis chinensis TaxID=261450 RepID=A0A835IYL1_9MAGN|nr:hypothetical protein IFM89_012128 [Coptis chinensis]